MNEITPELNNGFVLFGLAIPDPWATLIKLALVIVIGIIATKILLAIIHHVLKKVESLDDMLNTFIGNAVKVICIIIIVAACLDTLGVNMGTIVAVLGAAGAAIALALKDSLANIAGGIMIIITQPFKRGDLINIGEYRGRVQNIDLFLTTLRTLNYQIITVPNGLINTSILVNESREEVRRVDMEFGVSYGSDVELAKKIMLDVCKECPMALDEPKPIVGVRGHEDSAVTFDLLVYCKTEDFFETGYYIKEHVKLAFDANGIEIPFPHMDVRVAKTQD